MEENPIQELYPSRHSIRLGGYDYSWPGAYFITICTDERQCLFGDISGEKMILNRYGQIVRSCWGETPWHHPSTVMDVFVIMPNHVHGIVEINDSTVRAGQRPAPTGRHPLSEIIRAFKSVSAHRINELRKSKGQPVWQRGYYEHIIHSEEELDQIGNYINTNPANWGKDAENPTNRSTARRGGSVTRPSKGRIK